MFILLSCLAIEGVLNFVFIMQAGVRSFIITFDVYFILNIFEKYDEKSPDPICGAASATRALKSALSLRR